MRSAVGGTQSQGCWPRRWWLGAVLAACLVWAAPAQAQPFVYVGNDGCCGLATSSSVSQYNAGMSGLLAPLSPPTVIEGGSPSGVAVSPDGKSVYVANDEADTLSQYDVGPGGVLTPKSPATVAAGGCPSWPAVSPDGKSVYLTDTCGNTVSQYDVGPGGVLTPKSPATVPANAFVDGLAVSPDGKTVYAVGTVGDEAAGVADQFGVGPGGSLTPKSPAFLPVASGASGVAVSPDSKSVYVTSADPNTEAGTVSQFDVGSGGALTPKSRPTVSAGFGAIGVVVSPDGKSVYVADANTNAVLQFDVGLGGLLTPKSPFSVPAGFGAVWLAVGPDGKSLYVTSGVSGVNPPGSVSQYEVGAGGALTPGSPLTVPAGVTPEGIAVTPLPRVPTSKNQCKNGGWRNFGTMFKNQGQCVAFVVKQARQKCLNERAKIGLLAFRNKYGLGRYHVRAMRRCINQASR